MDLILSPAKQFLTPNGLLDLPAV